LIIVDEQQRERLVHSWSSESNADQPCLIRRSQAEGLILVQTGVTPRAGDCPLGAEAVNDVMRDDGTRREVGSPRASRAVILIRLLVGLVFFEEGIQKFLFPAVMGAGRFARIGIPAPDVMGPFVGVVEIVCGAMLVLGLLTRLAAIPLLVDIAVAILSTKLPSSSATATAHSPCPN
jgi:uncharacterized membrane protein YphA (DoxX/SURF4 family)